MLIVFELTELLHSCSKWIIYTFQISQIESVFKKILFKIFCFEKKNEKWNKIKYWKFAWTYYTLDKCNIFYGSAKMQQYVNSITSIMVQ